MCWRLTFKLSWFMPVAYQSDTRTVNRSHHLKRCTCIYVWSRSDFIFSLSAGIIKSDFPPSHKAIAMREHFGIALNIDLHYFVFISSANLYNSNILHSLHWKFNINKIARTFSVRSSEKRWSIVQMMFGRFRYVRNKSQQFNYAYLKLVLVEATHSQRINLASVARRPFRQISRLAELDYNFLDCGKSKTLE